MSNYFNLWEYVIEKNRSMDFTNHVFELYMKKYARNIIGKFGINMLHSIMVNHEGFDNIFTKNLAEIPLSITKSYGVIIGNMPIELFKNIYFIFDQYKEYSYVLKTLFPLSFKKAKSKVSVSDRIYNLLHLNELVYEDICNKMIMMPGIWDDKEIENYINFFEKRLVSSILDDKRHVCYYMIKKLIEEISYNFSFFNFQNLKSLNVYSLLYDITKDDYEYFITIPDNLKLRDYIVNDKADNLEDHFGLKNTKYRTFRLFLRDILMASPSYKSFNFMVEISAPFYILIPNKIFLDCCKKIFLIEVIYTDNSRKVFINSFKEKFKNLESFNKFYVEDYDNSIEANVTIDIPFEDGNILNFIEEFKYFLSSYSNRNISIRKFFSYDNSTKKVRLLY